MASQETERDLADFHASSSSSAQIDQNVPLNVEAQLQAQSAQQLQQAQLQMLTAFWNNQISSVEKTEPDFKNHALPLARIKKVMKSDEDVRSLMISAEAPIMFAKACEIFIEELTLRAWMHAEESKRRTLQKSDVSLAVARSDQYDFLIDIVPRDSDPLRGHPKQRSVEEVYSDQQATSPFLYHTNMQTQYPADSDQGYSPYPLMQLHQTPDIPQSENSPE